MTSTPVAVVTGASRHLGRTIALALGGAEYHVIVNARSDMAGADRVAAEIVEAGGSAEAFAADVTDPGAVDRMFARAAETGRVEVLVNNAAVRTRVPVEKLTVAEWNMARAVVLDGSFHCVRAALPALTGGGGAVVNILGANALAGDGGRVHVSAAKYGLLGLTLALADACRPQGVAVNAVSPIRMSGGDPAHAERARLAVAETVAWLASPAGRNVTGQTITVGGKG
jgi:3-oxoacyl-[acyl-carrier protein] reductase